MSVEPVLTTPLCESEPQAESAPLSVRLTILLTVLIPFLGLLAGIYHAWGSGFGWLELGLLAGMSAATAMGITIGFHRLFAHRAFKTVTLVRVGLGVLGSMAVQGPLRQWVAVHRRHHQYSDQADDPHSPHGSGAGVLGVLAGLWHAHVGWLFKADPPDLDRYVRDVRSDRVFRVVSTLFPVWVLLGLILPALVAVAVTGTWRGALPGFLWGGLVRVFVVHHITWSINSICHVWGLSPFQSHDHSKNNLLFGVLGFGEGWHNNHHAFPSSARHGLRWWELDMSYLVIRTLQFLGLAWDVRVPASTQILAKRS